MGCQIEGRGVGLQQGGVLPFCRGVGPPLVMGREGIMGCMLECPQGLVPNVCS
jgi:hypothetical protein